MSTTQTTSLQPGILVSTAITAGGAAGDCPIGTCDGQNNHVEGVVVSTAITAGGAPDNCPVGTCSGGQNNHAEGLVGAEPPAAHPARIGAVSALTNSSS